MAPWLWNLPNLPSDGVLIIRERRLGKFITSKCQGRKNLTCAFQSTRYAQCISKIVCKASGQTGSTNPDAVACVSYGECDCSRFKDDGSNEYVLLVLKAQYRSLTTHPVFRYFQCISNPNCAACTSPDATPAPPASSIYGLETVAPGTYSVTFDGTIKTVVVPSPTATTTELITVTAMSTLTLTITQDPTTRTTRVQTSTHKTTTSTLPTQTTADTTGSTAPVPTAPPTCPSYCTCEPKYGYPDT